MTRIAHLTDLHFGADDPAVVQGLIAHLNANPPDVLAVSGDLTQGARRPEFRAAMAFLKAINAPALIVPGNHDITPYALAERFISPYKRWREEVGRETEPFWQDGTVALVGLNTARRFGIHPDWSRGRVTRVRLQRLLARLDALPPSLTRIVVAHHPLLPPENLPLLNVVGGARRALASLASHGVRLVLAGHLHVSYSRIAVAGPSDNTQQPTVLQGGSATSVRLRGEPNAFSLITVDGTGTIAIQRYTWSGSAWKAAGPPS